MCVFEVIVLTPNFLGKFTFPFPELVLHSSVLPQRGRSVVLRVAMGVALDGPTRFLCLSLTRSVNMLFFICEVSCFA